MSQSIRYPVEGGEVLIDAADVDLVERSLVPGKTWRLIGRPPHRYAAYRMPTHKGEHVFMHRIIAGAMPGETVDHINRNPLDNRRANLRVCTQHQNLLNRPPNPNTSSQYKGVTRRGYKWGAAISWNGRQTWLGRFDSEEEAARAYDAAAAELHGEFAHLNFPKTA